MKKESDMDKNEIEKTTAKDMQAILDNDLLKDYILTKYSTGYRATFAHVYYGIGPYSRHACLKSNYWCWSNLFEHPLDLLVYLFHGRTTR